MAVVGEYRKGRNGQVIQLVRYDDLEKQFCVEDMLKRGRDFWWIPQRTIDREWLLMRHEEVELYKLLYVK